VSIDFKEIRELLNAISQADVAEFSLKSDQFELTVRKGLLQAQLKPLFPLLLNRNLRRVKPRRLKKARSHPLPKKTIGKRSPLPLSEPFMKPLPRENPPLSK